LKIFKAGPQKALYIPGAILKVGENEVVIFENYLGSNIFKTTDMYNYGNPTDN